MRNFAIFSTLFVLVLLALIFSSGLLGHLTAAINQSNAWGSWDARVTFGASSVAPFFCSWLLYSIWEQLPYEWNNVEYERRSRKARA